MIFAAVLIAVRQGLLAAFDVLHCRARKRHLGA
jgi:hypothetical protein